MPPAGPRPRGPRGAWGWATHGSENGWNCQTGDYAGTVEALLTAGAKPPAKLAGSPAVREVLLRHGGAGES